MYIVLIVLVTRANVLNEKNALATVNEYRRNNQPHTAYAGK